MTHQNAMKLYQFEPFKHIAKEQATVGALRKAAEGHDVSIQALSHDRTGDKANFRDWAAILDKATACAEVMLTPVRSRACATPSPLRSGN